MTLYTVTVTLDQEQTQDSGGSNVNRRKPLTKKKITFFCNIVSVDYRPTLLLLCLALCWWLSFQPMADESLSAFTVGLILWFIKLEVLNKGSL